MRHRRTALTLPATTASISQPSNEGLGDALKRILTGAPEHQSAAERRKISDYTGDVITQIKATYLNDQWLKEKTMITDDIPAAGIDEYTWLAKSDDPVARINYLLKTFRDFGTHFGKVMTPYANAVGKQTQQVAKSQPQFANQTFEKIYPIVMGIPLPHLDTPVMLGGYKYKPGKGDLVVTEGWVKSHADRRATPPKRDTLPALTATQVKAVAGYIVQVLEQGKKMSSIIYNSTPFVDVEDGGWNSEDIHTGGKLATLINHIDQPTAMGEWHSGITILSTIAFEKWCALSVK